MSPQPPTRRRGFTLVELIVVILILGILAAIGVAGYTNITDRAQQAAALANLRQIATATVAQHTADQAPQLTRAGMLVALEEASVDVVDGLSGASTWTLYGTDTAPEADGEFAVGFDTGQGTGANDVGGTRAVVITTGGAQLFARVIVYGGPGGDLVDGTAGSVPDGTTPTDVLGDPTLVTDPAGPADPGDPGDPGDGGNDAGAGLIGATVAVYVEMADGQRYETAHADVSVVPDATVRGQGGMQMMCSATPGFDDAVAGWFPTGFEDMYWDGGDHFVGDWGPWDPVPASEREYTCTLRAVNATGQVLDQVRATVRVGGDPVVFDPDPNAEQPGGDGGNPVGFPATNPAFTYSTVVAAGELTGGAPLRGTEAEYYWTGHTFGAGTDAGARYTQTLGMVTYEQFLSPWLYRGDQWDGLYLGGWLTSNGTDGAHDNTGARVVNGNTWASYSHSVYHFEPPASVPVTDLACPTPSGWSPQGGTSWAEWAGTTATPSSQMTLEVTWWVSGSATSPSRSSVTGSLLASSGPVPATMAASVAQPVVDTVTAVPRTDDGNPSDVRTYRTTYITVPYGPVNLSARTSVRDGGWSLTDPGDDTGGVITGTAAITGVEVVAAVNAPACRWVNDPGGFDVS